MLAHCDVFPLCKWDAVAGKTAVLLCDAAPPADHDAPPPTKPSKGWAAVRDTACGRAKGVRGYACWVRCACSGRPLTASDGDVLCWPADRLEVVVWTMCLCMQGGLCRTWTSPEEGL